MTDETPAPMTGVIPYVCVEGASEVSAFYQKAFGAREVRREGVPDGSKLMHVHLEINGGSLMLCDPFPEHGHPYEASPGTTLQLVVEDGDGWWERAVAAGCEVVNPMQVMFWGDKWGSLRCPFNMNWAINSPVKKA